MINTSGYEHAFLIFGLLQGAIVFVMAWGLLVAPPRSCWRRSRSRNQTAHGYTPVEVLRSPVFYVMYVMFVLIAAGGLTMAASMAPIAKDLQDREDSGRAVRLGDAGAGVRACRSTGSSTASAGRSSAGCRTRSAANTRWRSPSLIGAAALLHARASPARIRWCSCWSPRCTSACTARSSACFPATQGDTFGAKYAAANAGMLYTAKGAGVAAGARCGRASRRRRAGARCS